MIDLTRTLGEGMPVWPGDPLFQARLFAALDCDGFQGTRYAFGSHTGTHLDAPRHYFSDGETLDALPLDYFLLPAAAIELAPFLAPSKEGPALISDDLIDRFAPVFERFPAVLLRTGWGARWEKSDFFSDFPSLTLAAAERLCDFDLKLLGVETPSLSAPSLALETGTNADLDAQDDAACHRTLLGRTPPILLLESLAGLEQLDAITADDLGNGSFSFADKTYTLVCFPLKIANADGCPVRAVVERRSRESRLPFDIAASGPLSAF